MQRVVRAGGERLEYTLIQTGRKNVEIRVVPPGNVRVFAPATAHLRELDQLVRERLPWIEQSRQQLKDYEARRPAPRVLRDGTALPLEGRYITLRLRPGAQGVCLVGEELVAGEAPPEALFEQVRRWYIERAIERFRQRMEHYQALIGRAPGRVTLREQKTKWGSCSSARNINFNWKLIMAPPQALDYVVVHELCHLYEFNHSPRFWSLVERYQPEYALWKKWLKQNGASLAL